MGTIHAQGYLGQISNWVMNWSIVKELTMLGVTWEGTLIFVGCVVVWVLLSWGIYSYKERVRELYDYPLFAWSNVFIYVGIWLIVGCMWLNGCFGHSDLTICSLKLEPSNKTWPGCPIISTLVTLAMCCLPFGRTTRWTKNACESFIINLFQIVLGFVITVGFIAVYLLLSVGSHANRNKKH